MEIVGRQLAVLTPAMSSALDALAEGIAKSSNSVELHTLDQAIDTFSADNLENAGVIAIVREGTEIPVIAESASFLSPADFATKFDNISESDPRLLEIQNHVQNSRFNQHQALASCTNNLFGGNGIVHHLIGKNGLLAEAFGQGSAKGTIHGQEKGIIIEDWVPDSNEKGDGSVKGWIVDWKGADRGIIINNKAVDGNFLNDQSRPMESLTPQGFSSNAFLPPMDESVNKLRNLDLSTVEGQQTLFVFQQQLAVLQGMEKTVKNQAALQSQMGKSLAGKIMA